MRSPRRIPVAGVLCALLVLLGLGAAAYRFALGLGASTHLSDAYPWGLWIAFDLALVAFSGGAFTLAAMVDLLRLRRYEPLLRPALLTGWLGYLSAHLILVVDLGRPDRFWGFLAFPNPHSPLYEVSWCMLLYTLVLTLELLPDYFDRTRRARWSARCRRVRIPIVIAGVTFSALHQSTLGTLFLAMPERLSPLWQTPILPLLFLVSAVGMGLAAVIAVAVLAGRAFHRPAPPDALAGLARASIRVWGLYLLLVVGRLAVAGLWGRALAGDTLSRAFLLEILGGVGLPLLLFSNRKVREHEGGLLLAALVVIAGVTLNRCNVALTGQRVPPGATYFPHWIEAAIQVGVLAGAVWAWGRVARFLHLLPSTTRPRPL